MDAYNIEIKTVFKNLKSSIRGLSSKDALLRLEKYGPNELSKANRINIGEMILRQFADLMVIILIVAAGVDFMVGDFTEGLVIVGIVIVNAVIGFFMEFKAERALEMLKKMVAQMARVVRDGKEILIEAKDIVPGDVLILEEGMKVAADARCFESNLLSTEEAALTGESEPSQKHSYVIKKTGLIPADMDNMVFMGTSVIHGTGKAVVVNTGMDTEFGKIAKLSSQTKKDKSPLQLEMIHMGKVVGIATFVVCVIVLVLGVFQGRGFFEMFKIAISLAVAAVPEGLPATLTIALAFGVSRMAKKNAIIRRLSSVETLGCTSVICSDKTGTLTQNKMSVLKIYSNDLLFDVDNGVLLDGKNLSKVQMTYLRPILENMIICNNAAVSYKDGNKVESGDPTEVALLNAALDAAKSSKMKFSYKRIKEIPFDSVTKMMSVVAKVSGKKQTYVKGAWEVVLDRCAYICVNGKKIALTRLKKNKIKKKAKDMEKNALRTLGFAMGSKELVFLGLAGMIDPPRPGVKDAVALTKKAGIKTFIITGDSGITAKAIAKKVGLATDKTFVVSGEDINNMSDAALKRTLRGDVIFARVTPEHKMRIVSLLEAQGHVVAVTGDGVNDAPALKKASIGIAMGAGTDVSKNAANMVLADNSFSSIVSAIKEGRTIYDNIKKFTLYIFSSNIGELFTVFFGMVFGLPLPLLAVQILAIDLGTDVLPSLALGVEPPEKDVMSRKPRKLKDKIMNVKLLSRLVLIGVIIAIGSLGLFFGEFRTGDYVKATTFAFVSLIFFQMFNVFNSRSEKTSAFNIGLFSNKFLLLSVISSIVLAVMLVSVPVFQVMFGTVSLSLFEWLLIIGVSSSVLIVEEIRKFFVRHKVY